MPSQKPKSDRILACVLCSQRKVKCDRKFPCINCTKARRACVPATSAPRRRREREPDATTEVLERLRQYEDLLQKNGVGFEPFRYKSTAPENESPRDSHGSESVARDQSVPYNSSPSTDKKTEMTSTSRTIWQTLRESPESQSGKDQSILDFHDGTIKKAWEDTFEHRDLLLLGSRQPAVDLSTLHPHPVHIFRFWQTYLDNVNPLLKVIHSTSMQTKVIDAVGNVKNMDPAFEALLFSIYCMSVNSLNAADCETNFGSSKEDLLSKYQHGCQQALLNSCYLRSADRNCLTALFLYLLSIGFQTDPRSLSSMLGIAVRIAQRMGIHKEDMLAHHTPFEAEMRRRLWWALMRIDSRIGEMADYKVSMLSPATWDCKTPLNVNDSDLRPEMKEAPVAQIGPSDALFAVVSAELVNLVGRSQLSGGFTTPSSAPKSLPGIANELNALEDKLENSYLRTCLAEIPIHFMTICVTRAQVAKYRLIEYFAKCGGPATSLMQQSEAQRDAALTCAFNIFEYDTKIATSPLTKGYLWLTNFYFPFPAFMHVCQDMRRRPLHKHAEKAWQLMSDSFEARMNEETRSSLALLRLLAKVILPGWEAREAALSQSGQPIVPPKFIHSMRRYLGQDLGQPAKDQPGNFSSSDMNSFQTTIPGSVGPDNLFYNMSMGGPYAFWGLQNLPDMSRNQFDWPMMDWNTSVNSI